MRCPKCGSEMNVEVWHYSWERVVKYICPKCGYTITHHYPRKKKPYKFEPEIKPVTEKWKRIKVM